MSSDTMITAVIDDLMFQSKVRTIARARGVEVPVRLMPAQALDDLRQSAAQERVLVLDLESPSFDGIEIAQNVKRDFPDTTVVGFCHHMETDLIRRAKNARVDVVVPRIKFEQLFIQMVEAIRPDTPPSP